MRVVSQNEMVSVDFDRTVFVLNGNAIVAKIAEKNVVFGKYESDERAKEVFQDMHKAYAPVYSVSNGLTKKMLEEIFAPSPNMVTRNVLNLRFGRKAYFKTFDNYVYYMPKK